MKNQSDYCTELMRQDFSDVYGKNYAKVAIMLYLKYHSFQVETSVADVAKFVYRFFIDQPKIAAGSSNLIIKGLRNYTYHDLVPYVNEILLSWIAQGCGVLTLKDDKITTSCVELSNNDIEILNSVVDVVLESRLDVNLKYNPDISPELKESETYVKNNDYGNYIKSLNVTRFRNRAFERIRYCACCDECDQAKLYALHINPEIDFTDVNNSIVLCEEHTDMYMKGMFKFYRNGKIKIISPNESLDPRMHLSRRYLDKYNIKYFESV